MGKAIRWLKEKIAQNDVEGEFGGGKKSDTVGDVSLNRENRSFEKRIN